MEKKVKMDDEEGRKKEVPISEMLSSIERYNPDHLKMLEEYVEEQAKNNSYDLEANLAVLKLYQFNPAMLNMEITYTILLKALTNLPCSDFVLAKCLLLPLQTREETVKDIIYLADILEKCDFTLFWQRVEKNPERFQHINGFFDSIRKFICHVIDGTFQTIEKSLLKKLLGDVEDKTLDYWMKVNGWKHQGKEMVMISLQDEKIKTKNITEKIEFENLSTLMAQCL